MYSDKMNPSFKKEYSALTHCTWIDDALRIVDSGFLESRDPGSPANFGTKANVRGYLRNNGYDVILHFRWEGQHRTVGSSVLGTTCNWYGGEPYNDTVYHLTDDDLNTHYWQSSIYSTKNKLFFLQASLITEVKPKFSRNIYKMLPNFLIYYLDYEYAQFLNKQGKVLLLNSMARKSIEVQRMV